jgi:hypothetical protein
MGNLRINPWLAFINKILDTCVFSNIWNKQGIITMNERWLASAVRHHYE